MATGGLYGSTSNSTTTVVTGMATGGLYGSTSSGTVAPQSGSESVGLYGNNTVFGGSYFEWFIFQESATQPATPTGGSWSFTTNVGTPPTGWSNIPPAAPVNLVWVSIALVNSKSDATLTWSVPGQFSRPAGTVTNVSALTLGTTGTDVSSTVANSTTTPVITLNLPTASATNRGALSAADWTTFNSKGVGSVTSVAATVPSFLSVAGSPITTSGTLAISYSGTALPVANGGTGVTTSTGTGSVVLSTSPSLTTPTQVTYENWTPISEPSYTEGRVWYDSNAHALAYFNDAPNSVAHVGHELQVKVINNTGSSIPNGSPVYITSTSSGQTYPNIALARADVAATASVIGLTNGAIANGAFGYVISTGTIDDVNTGTYTVGQVLYLSPYSAGQLMNTLPPTGLAVQVGVVEYVNSSAGKIYVKQTTPLSIPASIISGAVAIANGGTGQTTQAAAITALAGTQASGQYLRSNGTNTLLSAIQAADVPTLNQNTTGTAANITATSNSTLTTLSSLSLPGSQVSGNISGNAANVTGTVAVANGGTGLTTTPANGVLDIGNGTGFTRTTLTAGTGISVTNASGSITIAATNAGTVTSVTGIAPVVSSGGATPAISLAASYGDTQNPYASKTANYVLAAPNGSTGAPTFRAIVAADIPTLNQNTTGTAANITATSNSTLTTLSALSLPYSQLSGTVPTWNQNTTGTASNVTGTVAIVNGGTGATTAAAALTSLGAYPASNPSGYGTGSVTSVAATVPAFLSVTGSPITTSGTLAISYSGTALPIANGGTGQTTAAAAFNALSPITTAGDLILGNGVNSAARLGIGANGYVLTSNGTTASWAAATGGVSQIIAGTNVTISPTGGTGAVTINATGGGGSLTISNDTSTVTNLYPTFLSATSGNASTIYTGNAKLLYKPSTGELQASEVTASNGIFVNATTVAASYTIGTGYNAHSIGPVTVATGQAVTISSGQRWLIF